MRTEKASGTAGIAQALAKGHCPICAILAEFQTSIVEGAVTASVTHLCNYHAWAVAKAAPAEVAAQMFLRLVERSERSIIPADDLICDLCEKIRQREIARVDDMIQQFKRVSVREWMKLQGSFCLVHARKLGELLPADVRDFVSQITRRNQIELKEELTALLEHLTHGDRTGWGVLGRAAEFLTSQRGITR